jgi:hypothetical protein
MSDLQRGQKMRGEVESEASRRKSTTAVFVAEASGVPAPRPRLKLHWK